MTIDVHTHVVPAGLPFGAGADPRWATLDVTNGDVTVGGRQYRRVRREAWDLEWRITQMDQRGCTAQVLSPMPYLFSYWADVNEAQRFTSELNQWLAAAVRHHPDRFFALGIIPMQDADAAINGLHEVKRLGLHGVELGTNIDGVSIAHPRFKPILQEAARYDLSVFLHAFEPPIGADVTGPARSAVCFPLDIGFAVAALIANGTLQDCPTLRLCASHGGGSVAFSLPRLTHQWHAKAPLRERLHEPPDRVLRRLFYDILLFDPHALTYLLKTVGERQVVVGSDFPFLDVPPEWPLCDVQLSAETRNAIRTDNALRFLGLPSSPRASDG
jgi:aminocarboxymuconate-semialdehyde decarboxylase